MLVYIIVLHVLTASIGVVGSSIQTRLFKKIALPSSADLGNYVDTISGSTAVLCSKMCVDQDGCKSFVLTTSGVCRLYTAAYTPATNYDNTVAYYIRQGEDMTCVTTIGFEYNGYLATTTSGSTCLRWDSVPITYPASSFIDGSVTHAENFCREPTLNDVIPWCYVSGTSWQYCSVGFCCISYAASSYTGNVSRTETGLTCQRWDSQSPHNHGYFTSSALQNYCRASHDTPGRTWCYTIDPAVRWQYCSVKQCGY